MASTLAVLLLGGLFEVRSQPIVLSPEDAARQGPVLAREILSLKPESTVTNSATVRIRDAKGKRTQIPVSIYTVATETNWQSRYSAFNANAEAATNLLICLTIIHAGLEQNEYRLTNSDLVSVDFHPGREHITIPTNIDLGDHGGLAVLGPANSCGRILIGNATMIPFAGSDFWVADLGLEFLHWPTQRLLRKEIRRGQGCDVLESVNPQPAPGAYSRVVSWVDRDTDGIINAEAYDSKGKLLKEFAATDIKKVRGQWELKGMEISNRQTGSRTTIEFDLGGGK